MADISRGFSQKTSQPFASIFFVSLFLAAVVSPLVVAVLSVPITDHSLLSEVAKKCGLAGVGILLVQPILAGRLRIICNVFSLGDVMLLHRSMGVLSLTLLVPHPILMAIGEDNWRLIFGWSQPWDLWVGKLALTLMLGLVVTSLYRAQLKLKYERWRTIHNILAGAVIGLALLHSWVSGGDLKSWPMQVLWLLLGGVAISIYIRHRWIRPKRLDRCLMHVSEVRQESPDVWTLRLAGADGWTADHLPGQFHFLTFPNDAEIPAEEHHFTIASSPIRTQFLESTIKATGDFTSKIRLVKPGAAVTVDGAYGRFSYLLHPDEVDLVFIAGGIGITPLMSMLRCLRDTGSQKRVRLLYGNKTESDIVFRDELDEMHAEQANSITVTHVLSNPDQSWSGERGHIDEKKIKRLIGDIEPATGFYVCGPEAMARQVIQALREQGVQNRQVHAESFSLMRDTAPTSSSSQSRRRMTFVAVVIIVTFVVVAAVMTSGGAEADQNHHAHEHHHSDALPSNSILAAASHHHVQN